MTQTESEQLDLKIDEGIKAAVAASLEEHRRMGRPIVVWQDGQVVSIPPAEINAARAKKKEGQNRAA
jgi:hypothetical protein